jgi:hypothetical protein
MSRNLSLAAILVIAAFVLGGCGKMFNTVAPSTPDQTNVFVAPTPPEGAVIGGSSSNPWPWIQFRTALVGSRFELRIDDNAVPEYTGVSPDDNFYHWNSLKVPNGPHRWKGTIISVGGEPPITEVRNITVNNNNFSRIFIGDAGFANMVPGLAGGVTIKDFGVPGHLEFVLTFREQSHRICFLTEPWHERIIIQHSEAEGVSPLKATLPYDGTDMNALIKNCDTGSADGINGKLELYWVP